MKKKIYALLMMTLLVFVIGGCGKKDKDNDQKVDVKADVLNFVNNELPAIEDKRNTAIGIYNSYFENDNVDINVFLSDMENKAIPNMQSYMDDLDAIETASQEVQALKELYSLGCQFQLDAMNKVVLAIKEENAEYLTEASEMIAQSEIYLAQYEQELRTLAENNNIKINGSTETGTATDSQ